MSEKGAKLAAIVGESALNASDNEVLDMQNHLRRYLKNLNKRLQVLEESEDAADFVCSAPKNQKGRRTPRFTAPPKVAFTTSRPPRSLQYKTHKAALVKFGLTKPAQPEGTSTTSAVKEEEEAKKKADDSDSARAINKTLQKAKAGEEKLKMELKQVKEELANVAETALKSEQALVKAALPSPTASTQSHDES